MLGGELIRLFYNRKILAFPFYFPSIPIGQLAIFSGTIWIELTI
jgi:hypothetical protein